MVIKTFSQVMRINIFVLSGVGALLSIAALVNHFSLSASQYCMIGSHFNCDLVNRSKYSTVAGVPVALIGAIGYSTVLGLTIKNTELSLKIRHYASLTGLAFSVYLTAVEVVTLREYCIICLASLVVITGIVLSITCECDVDTQKH